MCDWSAKWVQRFELGQGGTMLFNHITGNQMVERGKMEHVDALVGITACKTVS